MPEFPSHGPIGSVGGFDVSFDQNRVTFTHHTTAPEPDWSDPASWTDEQREVVRERAAMSAWAKQFTEIMTEVLTTPSRDEDEPPALPAELGACPLAPRPAEAFRGHPFMPAPASPPPGGILDQMTHAIEESRQRYRDGFPQTTRPVVWDEAAPLLPEVLPAVPPADVAERAYQLTRQAMLPEHLRPASETP